MTQETVYKVISYRQFNFTGKMSDNVGLFERVEHLACSEVVHTQSSCLHAVTHLVGHNMKLGLALYVPWTLAFMARDTKELSPSLIVKAFKSGLRSCLWLAVWVPGFTSLMCAYFNRYGSHSKLATFVSGFTAGFAAMELQPAQPLRQRLLMYLLNNAIETTYKLLASAGIVKMIPNGECLTFAFALSILSYMAKHHPERIALKKVIEQLEGNPEGDQPAVIISAKADAVLKIPSEFASSPAGYVVSGAVRAFLLAMVFKSIGSFIELIKRLLKKPVVQRDNSFLGRHGFTLFFVFTSALYRFTRQLIRTPILAQSKYSALLPGFVAGLASLFWPSVAVSQFLLSQSLDSIWQTITAKNIIIAPKKGHSILFGLATAILFYAATFNPSTVRASTLGLLGRLSSNNFLLRPKDK